MELKESSEMYLETIYLLENDHGHAHGVDIAEKLKVSKASVTKAVKNLKALGYLRHESYGSITLTSTGRMVSEDIFGKHKMISKFLKHSLGISKVEAEKNACKMEHILTDEILVAIKAYIEKNSNEK